MIGGTFAFSEAEKERVLSFQIERGLNVAKNVHVPVDFDEEGECNIHDEADGSRGETAQRVRKKNIIA